MTAPRPAAVLRDVDRPAWPEIEQLVASTASPVRVVPADRARRDEALEALQVSTASFLGALVGECGALVVDGGWLRLLGAGAEGIPGVHRAVVLDGAPPPFLEVARDVLGGRFAINGGGLDAPPGEVCYWGPDTLEWTPIGGGHAAFVTWALSGGTAEFYAALRWPGWEAEVADLALDAGLSLVPPPFSAQGRDLADVSRAVVPVAELHAFYADVAAQLRGLPDGAAFEMRPTLDE